MIHNDFTICFGGEHQFISIQMKRNLMKENHIRESLHFIIQNEPETIKAYVAKQALKHPSSTHFFKTLAHRGCVSGMITTLNSYKQTHQFFNQYYQDIEFLRIEYRQKTGIPISIKYDLKTSLTWFAFEQTAQVLANELNLFNEGGEHD